MTRWYASAALAPARHAALLALVVFTLLAGGQPALACSCMPLDKPQQADLAQVVFTGVARSVSGAFPVPLSCTRSSMDPVFVTFDVETVYKGDAKKETVVRTVANGASCGYTFAAGKRYTVFAATSEGALDTNLCRGNVEGTIAPAEYGLSAGRAP
jgi:hypothetical protein